MTGQAPAFDLQVNGYNGVDFNADDVSVEAFEKACAALREDGNEQILATIITSPMEAMEGRLRAIVEACEASSLCREVIAGIHIEGPFISPITGYVGAHPVAAVRAADKDLAKRLLDAAGGMTRLMTLAPEQDPTGTVTEWLSNEGVIVSAGHCDPSLDQLKSAIEHGLSMVTHVGNGCPAIMHRHNNIIQRVLSLSDDLWLCFIPDGVHVDYFALRNYVHCAGLERTIMVTDAIGAARLGPGTYTLAGLELEIGEDLVARLPGTQNFAGSTVTMPKVRENLRKHLGFSPAEIDLVISENPRTAVPGVKRGRRT